MHIKREKKTKDEWSAYITSAAVIGECTGARMQILLWWQPATTPWFMQSAARHRSTSWLHTSECKTCHEDIKPPDGKVFLVGAAQFACWVHNKWRNFQPFPIKKMLFARASHLCWVLAFAAKQNRPRPMGKSSFREARKIPFSVAAISSTCATQFSSLIRRHRPGKFNFLPSKALSERPLCFVPLKNNGDLVLANHLARANATFVRSGHDFN